MEDVHITSRTSEIEDHSLLEKIVLEDCQPEGLGRPRFLEWSCLNVSVWVHFSPIFSYLLSFVSAAQPVSHFAWPLSHTLCRIRI